MGWKHEIEAYKQYENDGLSENHSGMETKQHEEYNGTGLSG